MRKVRAVSGVPPLAWCDARPGDARVTLMGSWCAIIENFSFLAGYTPECVRICARGGEIRVVGQGLSLSEVRQGCLIVRGHVTELSLPEAPHA